ncbi:NUDIX hydrolase [Alicyclobacillus macrosporangiidus]|uniref:8-oxo-dGTP diphosphatase n=1 Tax=Alicyclobacillus macrosporangiidus TaxID=392015 RepID=A0A1I7LJQ6_9BACL|nr:8-oxo-dGTP diphosphatase [Alicyclobacillus macrosporangiidus]
MAYALILDEKAQSVLMVQNADNASWTLPGGAVELGETLDRAVVREVYEETGLRIHVGRLVSVHERLWESRQEHVLFFTFTAEILGGEPRIMCPEEISAVEWVSISLANEYLSYHPGGVEALLHAGCPYVDESNME